MTSLPMSMKTLTALLATTLLSLALLGCPSTGTTVCVPSNETEGCWGTEWEEFASYEQLPDGDGGCPVGVYLFCPSDTDIYEINSREVMVSACNHASEHNWSTCQVRYLCGPYEGVN